MKRVRNLGRRLVNSRISGSVVASMLGFLLALAQQTHFQSQKATVHASSLEAMAVSMMVKLPPPKPVDCKNEPCVALTFDDGPASTTPRILDALQSEGARATFFVVGREIAGRETIVRREAALGNEIGNHSWSHPNFTKIPPANMLEQMQTTSNAIVKAGAPSPHLFRPPYGFVNQLMLDTIHSPMILWNVDPKDWHEKDPAKLAHTIAQQARAGAIIILHDNKPTTADAAKQFIHELNGRFHLVTVSELLRLGPYAQGVFYGRPPE